MASSGKTRIGQTDPLIVSRLLGAASQIPGLGPAAGAGNLLLNGIQKAKDPAFRKRVRGVIDPIRRDLQPLNKKIQPVGKAEIDAFMKRINPHDPGPGQTASDPSI